MENKIEKSVTLTVPDLNELSRLYRKAITANDKGAAVIAEHAALKYARGEAAIREANVLAQFINSIG